MNNQRKNQVWWEPALEVFMKLSAWIVAPIIISLFLGKYLDNKFDTKPWIFLGLTAFAFLISTIGIVKESIAYIKEIEEKDKRNDELKIKD